MSIWAASFSLFCAGALFLGPLPAANAQSAEEVRDLYQAGVATRDIDKIVEASLLQERLEAKSSNGSGDPTLSKEMMNTAYGLMRNEDPLHAAWTTLNETLIEFREDQPRHNKLHFVGGRETIDLEFLTHIDGPLSFAAHSKFGNGSYKITIAEPDGRVICGNAIASSAVSCTIKVARNLKYKIAIQNVGPLNSCLELNIQK